MLRNIGIFILCSGLAAVIFTSGVMAYYLFEELAAYGGVMQTSQKLQEKIDKNKEKRENKKAEKIEKVEKNKIAGIPEKDFSQPAESVFFTTAAEDNMRLIEINGEMYTGILSIPSLSLSLPINASWSYERLKKSPCRYSGSISDSMVICAHDYKSHFGRLSKIQCGDAVTITDAAGREYKYKAVSVSLLDETAVNEMINSPYELTLFTCDSKDDTKRVAVRCVSSVRHSFP